MRIANLEQHSLEPSPKNFRNTPHQFDPKLIATLVKQLTALDSLQIKDEVLHTLKADEAQAILVAIIGMKEYANQRKIIVAACWESGLDFTNYFTFSMHLP